METLRLQPRAAAAAKYASEDDVRAVDISFVLPCLNEEQTVGLCVRECRSVIERLGAVCEVVIADNHSEDGSVEIAQKAGARVILVPDRGYGRALLAGIKEAKGKYVIIADSDMSYDFREAPRFLEKLRQGYDLVMGCRMPCGGGTICPGAMPCLHRWLGTPFLSTLCRILFGTDIRDVNCGIRAFHRERLLGLNLSSAGMEFASELVVKAALAQFAIAEVPVTLRPDGRKRRPHLRTWRDGWRHLCLMLFYSPRWLITYPGLIITYVAMIFMVGWPLPEFRQNIAFDSCGLWASAVALLVGFNILTLGLFSEVFGCRCGILPSTALSRYLGEHGGVKMGMIVGGSFLLGGLLFLTVPALEWVFTGKGTTGFLDIEKRIVAGVSAIALGVQGIFAGFVLTMLGLGSKGEAVLKGRRKDLIESADTRKCTIP